MCKGILGITGRSGNTAVRQLASALAISCILIAPVSAEVLPVSADTYTRSDAPGANFGNASKIRVRSPSHAGYFFFDLGSLGSGEVLGATLRIHVQKVDSGANVAVHEVLGTWSEGTLTHQTAPPLNLIPTAESPVAPGDVGKYLAIDVTALVNGWIANPASNFGLALQSQPSGKNILFSSREAGFPAELEVELGDAEKPNLARVEVQGGDYSNPIDAIDDRDSWCDLSSLARSDHCQLLIGPGTFSLAQPLELPDQFAVLGAGNTGSQRTELVAQPGVETVIQLAGSSFGARHVVSDLRVRNSGGANGNVRGIDSNALLDDAASATIRNVSVDVSGGVADETTGISVGIPVLQTVDVSVNGGSNAVGIITNCANAADVRVRVRADTNAQSSVGWQERSNDCGPPLIVRFNVSSFGGPNSIGILIQDRGAELSEGLVAAGAIGISTGGEPELRNLRIIASTGIELSFGASASIDNVNVKFSETALSMQTAFSVQVTGSTLLGEVGILADADNNPRTIRIDSSTIGPITIENGAGTSVFIGSSKVTGPIVPGAGQLTCINVYDQNYQPITCD